MDKQYFWDIGNSLRLIRLHILSALRIVHPYIVAKDLELILFYGAVNCFVTMANEVLATAQKLQLGELDCEFVRKIYSAFVKYMPEKEDERSFRFGKNEKRLKIILIPLPLLDGELLLQKNL